MNSVTLKPIDLLAGGHRRSRTAPDPLLTAVLAGSGRPAPTVAYVGAASGDDRDFFGWFATLLRKAGAGVVRLAPLAGKAPDREKAGEVLSASDLIFVSGGDVEEGMRLLKNAHAIPLLRALYRRGIPFFGLSAGSIMLANQWVRWKDAEDESTAEPFDCLGLAQVLCDTHGESEGWEELKALLRLKGNGALGYGIPTAAGLRVHPGGEAKALGGPVHRFINDGGNIRRLGDLRPARTIRTAGD